jgi:hypothetical protein
MKQKWISNLLQYFLYLRFLDIIKRRVATAIPIRKKVKHTRRKTMTNTSTVAQRDGEKLPTMEIQVSPLSYNKIYQVI